MNCSPLATNLSPPPTRRQLYILSGKRRPMASSLQVAGKMESGDLQLAHLGQELAVALGFREAFDQQFHGFDGRKRVQHFAQHPNAL